MVGPEMIAQAPVLVTGAAGFIGFHLAKRLMTDGFRVVGFDNLNEYYDVSLKRARLAELEAFGEQFTFIEADLEDAGAVGVVFEKYEFRYVVHLAAQAGVRHSLDAPHSYVNSNIVGFLNMLEACRFHDVEHLIYASSSSVYGGNRKMPFRVTDNVDHPKSLYAATKKSNELMAHAYADLFGIPMTGLRFFTVYGPYGRPDMAALLFLDAMYADKPIQLFGEGNLWRDFTYIDDIVESMVRLLPKAPQPDPNWSPADDDPSTSWAPARVFNIGGGQKVPLMRFVNILEAETGITANKELLPMQPGDVMATWADCSVLEERTDFAPSISIDEGLKRTVAWYKDYYKIED